MTNRQRQLLKQLIRSGEMWDALCEVLTERATAALKLQDELVYSSEEAVDLAKVIKLTTERMVLVSLPDEIQEEANRREQPPEESPE